nr:Hypothetical protein CBG06786 [Haemonchus contortus]
MWTDPEIKKMSMYRLMNQINIIDFFQPLCHFVSGFFAIYPEIIYRSPFFSSFIGSTANSLWQAMFPYIFVLSIGRILIIKKKMDPNKLALPIRVILFVGWLFTITVWLWSWFGMAFVFGKIGWKYDYSMWSSPYLKFLELGWCVPTLLTSYLIYLGIIVHFELSKRHVSSTRSHRHEFLIFCHATLLNGYILGLMACFHASELFGFTENYHHCIINCIWILFSYLNPILLIVLNRTVRQKFLHFVFFKKMTLSSPKQITTGETTVAHTGTIKLIYGDKVREDLTCTLS